MENISRRALGRRGVAVTEVGFGGAPLGELFERVSEDEAQATLQAAWDAGVRYFDTAPFYGFGKSEHRIGRFLREKPRGEFVLSTKVGRVLRAARDLDRFDRGQWVGGLPFEITVDYSYDGIMRSYEDSLQRLGLSSVDLLLVHDLDYLFHRTEEKVTAYMAQFLASGWRALEALRSGGQIKGVGAGLNGTGMIPRFLDNADVDCFIVAMPYTLLDQRTLDVEFVKCAAHGAGVVIGAVFASGILATGPVDGARYAYAPASPEVLEKTRRIEAVCRRHNVPLAAAALQFPLAHPVVSAIIPGAFQPEHVRTNLGLYRQAIPADLWTDLKAEGLLREDAPTPGG